MPLVAEIGDGEVDVVYVKVLAATQLSCLHCKNKYMLCYVMERGPGDPDRRSKLFLEPRLIKRLARDRKRTDAREHRGVAGEGPVLTVQFSSIDRSGRGEA